MQNSRFFDRAHCKSTAKDAMRGRLPSLILLSLIPALLSAATALYTYSQQLPRLLSRSAETAGGSTWFSTILSLLIFPLTAAICHSFTKVYAGGDASLSDAVSHAKRDYLKKLLTNLLAALYTFLWTLLLIVPGIIKAIEYSMISYILDDYPNLSPAEAVSLSSKMMKGHRMDFFVLELSFIGWALLSALTANILEIVYVAPYRNTTLAGFYLHVRGIAIDDGIVGAPSGD